MFGERRSTESILSYTSDPNPHEPAAPTYVTSLSLRYKRNGRFNVELSFW
jgi:hypothetical protein